jgi:hypothetical protein
MAYLDRPALGRVSDMLVVVVAFDVSGHRRISMAKPNTLKAQALKAQAEKHWENLQKLVNQPGLENPPGWSSEVIQALQTIRETPSPLMLDGVYADFAEEKLRHALQVLDRALQSAD